MRYPKFGPEENWQKNKLVTKLSVIVLFCVMQAIFSASMAQQFLHENEKIFHLVSFERRLVLPVRLISEITIDRKHFILTENSDISALRRRAGTAKEIEVGFNITATGQHSSPMFSSFSSSSKFGVSLGITLYRVAFLSDQERRARISKKISLSEDRDSSRFDVDGFLLSSDQTWIQQASRYQRRGQPFWFWEGPPGFLNSFFYYDPRGPALMLQS